MKRSRSPRTGQQGQILVIVALGMVALITITGLVLDGGSSYGQRRSQQRAADLAALAGANDLLLNDNVATAEATARSVATENGYDPTVVTVNVIVTEYNPVGGTVQVDIGAPHKNSFSSMIGLNVWNVSVTAKAVAGVPTGASAPGPFLFSYDDFQTNGLPLPQYSLSGCGAGGCAFGTSNGDAPLSDNDLAWTNYGNGNVDTSQVSNIISGQWVPTNTIAVNQYIGQHNNGFHNALFQDVNRYLAGRDVLVPITTEDHGGPNSQQSCGGPSGLPAGGGCFQGWGIFHVVQAVGGSDKHIYGYFTQQKFMPGGEVTDCTGSCPRSFGVWVLKLID
jgi:Flp pilus assembly protein TadG